MRAHGQRGGEGHRGVRRGTPGRARPQRPGPLYKSPAITEVFGPPVRQERGPPSLLAYIPLLEDNVTRGIFATSKGGRQLREECLTAMETALPPRDAEFLRRILRKGTTAEAEALEVLLLEQRDYLLRILFVSPEEAVTSVGAALAESNNLWPLLKEILASNSVHRRLLLRLGKWASYLVGKHREEESDNFEHVLAYVGRGRSFNLESCTQLSPEIPATAYAFLAFARSLVGGGLWNSVRVPWIPGYRRSALRPLIPWQEEMTHLLEVYYFGREAFGATGMDRVRQAHNTRRHASFESGSEDDKYWSHIVPSPTKQRVTRLHDSLWSSFAVRGPHKEGEIPELDQGSDESSAGDSDGGVRTKWRTHGLGRLTVSPTRRLPGPSAEKWGLEEGLAAEWWRSEGGGPRLYQGGHSSREQDRATVQETVTRTSDASSGGPAGRDRGQVFVYQEGTEFLEMTYKSTAEAALSLRLPVGTIGAWCQLNLPINGRVWSYSAVYPGVIKPFIPGVGTAGGSDDEDGVEVISMGRCGHTAPVERNLSGGFDAALTTPAPVSLSSIVSASTTRYERRICPRWSRAGFAEAVSSFGLEQWRGPLPEPFKDYVAATWESLRHGDFVICPHFERWGQQGNLRSLLISKSHIFRVWKLATDHLDFYLVGVSNPGVSEEFYSLRDGLADIGDQKLSLCPQAPHGAATMVRLPLLLAYLFRFQEEVEA